MENQQIIQLIHSLRELNQSIYQATRKEVEMSGVTQIQLLALRRLHQHTSIGLNELADLMHMSPSTASGVVDRLVQAALVVREHSDHDRRAIVLNLTEEGKQLVTKTSELILNKLSPLLNLSEEDFHHLLHIHEQLVEMLHKAREDN